MKTIFVLLVILLCIGLLTRTYNRWTRFLLFGAIGGMLLFIYIT